MSEKKPAAKTITEQIADMKDGFTALTTKAVFQPADIIQWKPGLQNNKVPGPFIVTEVLAEPVISDNPNILPMHPNFREPMDIKAGIVDPGAKVFIEFHLDSRRLELMDG